MVRQVSTKRSATLSIIDERDEGAFRVIGTSWWADMMHLPSLASHREAEVAAICGGNQDRAAEMAGKYGIKQVFTDCREVIDRGGIDAVVISVPDDLHHEMAIDAKLCVLCGKPLAVSLRKPERCTSGPKRRG